MVNHDFEMENFQPNFKHLSGKHEILTAKSHTQFIFKNLSNPSFKTKTQFNSTKNKRKQHNKTNESKHK